MASRILLAAVAVLAGTSLAHAGVVVVGGGQPVPPRTSKDRDSSLATLSAGDRGSLSVEVRTQSGAPLFEVRFAWPEGAAEVAAGHVDDRIYAGGVPPEEIVVLSTRPARGDERRRVPIALDGPGVLASGQRIGAAAWTRPGSLLPEATGSPFELWSRSVIGLELGYDVDEIRPLQSHAPGEIGFSLVRAVLLVVGLLIAVVALTMAFSGRSFSQD